MNTRHIIAAAVLALTGAAASASPSVFNDMPSTMSRAEVQAQIEQARAEGRLFRANDAYGAGEEIHTAADTAASPLTRDQVLAELAAARTDGELDVRGETYGNFSWNQFGNIEQPLPEQASVVAARETAANLARAQAEEEARVAAAKQEAESQMAAAQQGAESEPSIDSMSAQAPVLLTVPSDSPSITLNPGDSILLVPSQPQAASTGD